MSEAGELAPSVLLGGGSAEQGTRPPPSSTRPVAARPAAAFGIAGAGGVGVVTAAGVVAEVAAGAVVRLARVAHPVERRGRLRARGGGGRAAGAALGLAVVPGRHGVLLSPEAAAGGARGPFRTGVGRACAVCLVIPCVPLAHETQVDVLLPEVDRAQQAAVAVARLALYLHAAVQDALREVLPRLRAALLPQFRRVDADEPHLLLPPLRGDGDRVAVRHAQAAAFRRAERLHAEEEQEKEENEFRA